MSSSDNKRKRPNRAGWAAGALRRLQASPPGGTGGAIAPPSPGQGRRELHWGLHLPAEPHSTARLRHLEPLAFEQRQRREEQGTAAATRHHAAPQAVPARSAHARRPEAPPALRPELRRGRLPTRQPRSRKPEATSGPGAPFLLPPRRRRAARGSFGPLTYLQEHLSTFPATSGFASSNRASPCDPEAGAPGATGACPASTCFPKLPGASSPHRGLFFYVGPLCEQQTSCIRRPGRFGRSLLEFSRLDGLVRAMV